MSEPSLARRVLALLVAPALLIAATSCSDDDDPASARRSTTTVAESGSTVRQPALEGRISVLAADQLADAVIDAVARFREQNPGLEVDVRFDATPVLATEIVDGAPADVFLAAGQDEMAAVAAADRLDGPPQALALDHLVVVTPVGNPAGVTDLTDLGGLGSVALCDASTPCGTLADQALEAAGISVTGSRFGSGGEAIAAVLAGDADAALVFGSVAKVAGTSVAVVQPSASPTVTVTVATLTPSDNELAARALVDFLLGPDGLDVLLDHGFTEVG